MRFYRYSRWDDSQEVFPVREEDLLEQVSEQIVTQGDVNAALRTITQRGVQGKHGQRLPGLQDLQQRIHLQRQELLERYNLGSILSGIKEQLDEAKRLEQAGLERKRQEAAQRLQEFTEQGRDKSLQADLLRKLDQLAQKNQNFVNHLPQQSAPALQQLRDYEFMDPEAKEKFDSLLQWLQQQVLKADANAVSQEIQRLTPHDVQRSKEMLRDLNALLEQRIAGGEPDIRPFREQHGDLLGDKGASSLEGLVERLQRRAAQMESLLNSLTFDQRKQLEETLDASLQDPEIREQLTKLAANLEQLQAASQWSREYRFQGSKPLDLEQGFALMERLQGMDEVERQMRCGQQTADLAQVNLDLLRNVLDEQSTQEFQQLQMLTQMLEESGYITKVKNGYELTPKGIRKIGQKALQEIFLSIKRSQVGQHEARRDGTGTDVADGLKRYEFGDALALDLQRTLFNAMGHSEGFPPIKLQVQDFEVRRVSEQPRMATVLLLDLSLSMAMRGNFIAAKKVALALDNLIRTQFPRDTLHVVGFSTYAREIKAERLAYLNWDEFDPYTNIQHGLGLAQKLLSRFSDGSKQIIMVSDGEPTAHMEGGQLFLQYPPSPRTIRETLREVKQCTNRGITINTFMLDRSAHLMEFIDQMMRINRGRVFYTSPDTLGQYVLVDYLSSQRRLLSA
ncbi:MAG: VWA domain-containing protein [Dehalococcoidia bacterium]|nr:VWA domain-containing protein [Dehalococcoidia bacterium]